MSNRITNHDFAFYAAFVSSLDHAFSCDPHSTMYLGHAAVTNTWFFLQNGFRFLVSWFSNLWLCGFSLSFLASCNQSWWFYSLNYCLLIWNSLAESWKQSKNPQWPKRTSIIRESRFLYTCIHQYSWSSTRLPRECITNFCLFAPCGF